MSANTRTFELNQLSAFLLLVLSMLIYNLPFFDSNLWPQHDTTYAYQNFYTFYRQFFYANELARWYPFGTYGIKADLTQLFNLAPSAYFIGILGKILQIKNALFLFKFSLLIEEFMFLVGMFLLARFLFKDLKTTLFTCLAGIGSTAWYVQVYWNFRIYYLIPIIIYFFARFIKNGKGHDFWICGIIFICSFIGNLPYFAILYSPTIFILLITFTAFYRNVPWKNIFKIEKTNLLCFLICLSIGIIYGAFVRIADDGIVSFQRSRDPVHHFINLEGFLSNGSGVGFEKFLGFFFEISHENFTVYMGWLTLFFLIYGIIYVRKIEFFGFLTCGLFLAFFSAGKEFPLAELLFKFYYPMKWFQYIGQIASLGRIFFIVAAGFGFQHFLQHFSSRNKRLILLLGIGFILIFFMLIQYFRGSIPFHEKSLSSFYYLAAFLFSAALIFLIRSEIKLAACSIFIFLFLDFFFYQLALAANWPHKALLNHPNSATIIEQIDYQPFRISGSEFENHPRRIMAEQNPIERISVDALNFIGIDPCVEIYPSLLMAENVLNYLEIRTHYKRSKNREGFLSEWDNTTQFFYEVGCHVSKLRLFDSVHLARSETEAEQFLESNQDFNKLLILDPHRHAPQISKSNLTNLGRMLVKSFSYNQVRLEIVVDAPSGAWLYYADAFHPGWGAKVNHVDTKIYPANLAFKAIYLTSGVNEVVFSFGQEKSGFLSKSIAFIGLLFMMNFLAFTGIELYSHRRLTS